MERRRVGWGDNLVFLLLANVRIVDEEEIVTVILVYIDGVCANVSRKKANVNVIVILKHTDCASVNTKEIVIVIVNGTAFVESKRLSPTQTKKYETCLNAIKQPSYMYRLGWI